MTSSFDHVLIATLNKLTLGSLTCTILQYCAALNVVMIRSSSSGLNYYSDHVFGIIGTMLHFQTSYDILFDINLLFKIENYSRTLKL